MSNRFVSPYPLHGEIAEPTPVPQGEGVRDAAIMGQREGSATGANALIKLITDLKHMNCYPPSKEEIDAIVAAHDAATREAARLEEAEACSQAASFDEIQVRVEQHRAALASPNTDAAKETSK